MHHPSVTDPFEALFREHYARLCELVHGYVQSTDVAHDVVQDVFLALWQRRVDPASLNAAYLYTAVRNRALKVLRHHRVAQRYRERNATPEWDPRSTDDRVRQRETAEAIDAAIAQLPDKCREIFLLSRRQHMTNTEISAALGISVKTVETQMWRALRKLRASLSPYLTGAVVALLSARQLPLGL